MESRIPHPREFSRKQPEIPQSSMGPMVIGLGELLWDCFPDQRRPGGAPANVAFHANQLGCQGVVFSRVGQDPLGQELLNFLADQGLDPSTIQRDPIHPTGIVTVDTSTPDCPRFTIHEPAAWDFMEWESDWAERICNARGVCFGTLAQRGKVSRQTIHRLLEEARPDCLVVYDVNLRQHWYDRPGIEQSLARARIVKLNADEARTLAELLETGSTDLEGFCRAVLRRFPVGLVCVTRGAEGCFLATPHETASCPGFQVDVVDTVGSGDAFTAALMVGQFHGWPLARQGEFANRVGALVASRAGAMPRLAEQFAELLAAFA